MIGQIKMKIQKGNLNKRSNKGSDKQIMFVVENHEVLRMKDNLIFS
jgi:hypothetical protein